MWTIVNGLLQTRMLMVCHPKIIFRFLSNIYALTPTDFHCYVGSSGVQDETNDLDNVFLIQNSLRINRSLPVLGYLRDYSYLWEFIWITVDDILGTSFVLYRVNKSLFLRSHTARRQLVSIFKVIWTLIFWQLLLLNFEGGHYWSTD